MAIAKIEPVLEFDLGTKMVPWKRIAGYCGNSTALDEALAEWAESYGDQTEQDDARLVASINRGETKAIQSDDGS